MTLEGITPGDPGRVFEAWRCRLDTGDVGRLLSVNNERRRFSNSFFDLTRSDDRFFIVAAATFERCIMLVRPDQLVLFVDNFGRDIAHKGLRLEGGGQAVPRVLFSVLKNSATEGTRRIETTQTVDFSRLKQSRVFVRNLVALGDVVVGPNQTLVVDHRNCILLGDVLLHSAAAVEGIDGVANWKALRQKHIVHTDFESILQFGDDWERAPVIVVPRGLDFREGYPNELSLYDAVIGGDIHLKPGQSLTIGVTRQPGRRTSVLVRGSVLCDGAAPRIIGQRGFHALDRGQPALGPIVINDRVDRVG